MDMRLRRSHTLAPMTEADSIHKGREILWNYGIEYYFNKLKSMVSSKTLLSYPDCTIQFTFHTDAYDKQLGAVIIQNNKPIELLSRRLSKPQSKYTMTNKDLIAIVECLKQYRGIIFGYEMKVFSDNKNLVYAATLSESQRVMRW